jgi:hypothetical protein
MEFSDWHPWESLGAEPLIQLGLGLCHFSSPLHNTERFENSAELFEGSGNSAGNSSEILAVYWAF